MIASELTNRAPAATSLLMQARHPRKRWLLVGSACALSACVSVNAPDKPIVIELNINIKQEVIYKLAADAGNTIQENSDIF
jgi:YnbE-like lipoprotein